MGPATNMQLEKEYKAHHSDSLNKAILAAVSILTSWVLVVGGILYALGSAMNEYGAIINIAGKQRMLSQKAAYLTVVSAADPSVETALKATLEELATNQLIILKRLPTDALKQYYKDQQLSQKVDHYLSVLNTFNANDATKRFTLMSQQLVADSELILVQLDLAVSQLQQSYETAQHRLKLAQGAFVICSLVIIIFLYFGVIAAPFKRNAELLQLKNKSILRFKKLFDNAQDGLLLFDSNWFVTHANEQALHMATHENVERDAIHSIWQDRISSKLKNKVLKAIESEGLWQGEITTSDHKKSHVLASVMCVADEGELPFFCATLKDITLEKEKEGKLEKLALFDSLTGLANRANVIDAIDSACSAYSENDSQFAVYFIDLDGFKLVNDKYGHEIGDILLKAVAKRLRNQIQKTDIMARLGGDEFVILIKNVENKIDLHTLAERIQQVLDEPFTINGMVCKITVSIGISLSSDDARNAQTLLKQADIAMYHAKQKGKNQFYFFDHSMETFLQERISFEEDLYYGLSNDEFYQVFQPIVNIKTDEVIGCEALLRWNSHKKGMVSPASFIPMAESLSLMLEIDNWVFANSLSFLKRHPSFLHFSINLSPIHFVQATLLRTFLSSLEDFNPDLNVIFEVTETSIISDIEMSSSIIKEIKSYGHSVAIDDFGTGYTSLYYLKVLSFDYLKIDKSFIQDMLINDSSKAIVSAIINLARELNIKVIAEGVETAEAKNMLEQFNCEFAQGYLFARPIEEAGLHKYIK